MSVYTDITLQLFSFTHSSLTGVRSVAPLGAEAGRTQDESFSPEQS